MRKILCVLAIASVTGCVVARPRIADAPAPAAEQVTADFAAVFESRPLSNSVSAAVPDKTILRRVMLSPNLVFETSRSSMKEPETAGPRNAGDAAPNLGDALGRPVETWLSSLLMSELVRRHAILLAPAMSRPFLENCDDHCNVGTWVERVIFRYQRTAASAHSEDAFAEFPTALLAVREFGLGWREVDVIATHMPNGDLQFAPRRRPGEESACPPAKIELPVIRFSAEMIAVRDGRIVVRIDEATTPKFKNDTRMKINASTFAPVRVVGYENEDPTTREGRPPLYGYVERWDRSDASCSNALGEYKRMRDAALREIDLVALAKEVIANGLAKLGE